MGIIPIGRATLTEEVEDRIRAYILEEGLSVGALIPHELDLARQFGVSRTIVREALSRLRMLGIVQPQKRRGTAVGKPDAFAVLERVLEPQWMDGEELDQYREMRLALEIGIADFVCARATDNDIAKLEALVTLEMAAAADYKTSLEADVEFHQTLYEISGNAVIRKFQALLAPFFESARLKNFHADRFGNPAYVTHRDVIAALKSRDPLRYRDVMYKHLKPHFEAMLRRSSIEAPSIRKP